MSEQTPIYPENEYAVITEAVLDATPPQRILKALRLIPTATPSDVYPAPPEEAYWPEKESEPTTGDDPSETPPGTELRERETRPDSAASASHGPTEPAPVESHPVDTNAAPDVPDQQVQSPLPDSETATARSLAVVRRRRARYRRSEGTEPSGPDSGQTRPDDALIEVSVSYFDAEVANVAPDILRGDRIVQGTANYVAQALNTQVTGATDEYAPGEATESEAALLGLPEIISRTGQRVAPSIVRGRHTFEDSSGRVIEYGESLRVNPDAE